MTRNNVRRAACLVLAVGTMGGMTLPSSAGEARPPAQERLLVWTPDEQIRGYRNAEESFPVTVVKAGGVTRALPRGRPIIVTYRYHGVVGSVEDYIRRNRVAGLLVLRDGAVVLERYGLGQKPTDRWMTFSVGKSVTSTLVGAAIRDGFIKGVDEPVTNYIPELTGSAYDGDSIAEVLEMRSGVRWNEDYEDPNSDVSRIVSSMAHNRGDSLVALMKTLPRAAAPGDQFLYNSGEANLAGVIVARAIKKGLAEYLSEKIWTPYGMERDAVWLRDGETEVGGCCVNMTLRDAGRFGELILGGGKIDGKPTLPENWIRDATYPHTKNAWGTIGYGYLWWPHDEGSFEAIGIFGQSIYIDPAAHLVVVTFSAWPHASWDEGYERQAAFLEGIRSALATAKTSGRLNPRQAVEGKSVPVAPP